ncbi:polyprenyl synthetase family protein [Cellulomonas wangsupingiae]|uniref:Polyprenyl synthetase family protein n=1 Tax=Cellulomonas wangsupingiae TaxID=2968085 RepID=A0ABY5K5C7_9CELL|nr:polyprenyl synthetase family protein [Cellulomonas wangsupingiae]UUI64616.1 polyprenyl synthetase family protein [Cellulomonas wangsupingiae]
MPERGTVAAEAGPGGPAAELDAYVARVEDEVARRLRPRPGAGVLGPHADAVVGEVRRLALAPGKRMRPRWVRAAFGAAGGTAPLDDVVLLGAALELYHCAALIHDDVIDGADLRRGQASSHRWWADAHRASRWRGDADDFGRSVAILAGCLALGAADTVVAGLPPALQPHWAAMRTATVVGEFAELYATACGDDGPGVMAEVARLKTSHYSVVTPLLMGAVLAARDELQEPLREFGEAVGEAFQLCDDLLDATGTSLTAAKSTGVDAAAGRSTGLLARLTAWEPAIAAEPDMVRRHGLARVLLQDPAVLGRVRSTIDDLLDRAGAALDGAALDPGWDAVLRAAAARLVQAPVAAVDAHV